MLIGRRTSIVSSSKYLWAPTDVSDLEKGRNGTKAEIRPVNGG